jgi:hypothetical protein
MEQEMGESGLVQVTKEPAQRVTITDIEIPFVDLVVFLVKLAIAAIPAALIVAFLVFFGGAMLAAMA